MVNENAVSDGHSKRDDDEEFEEIFELLSKADAHLEKASEHHEAAKKNLETVHKEVSK